jgi:hypothetical protein
VPRLLSVKPQSPQAGTLSLSHTHERDQKSGATDKRGQRMATILPFVSNKIDFDDEATRIMGEAFDAACGGLQDTGQPALVREIIAKRACAQAHLVNPKTREVLGR